MSELRRTRRWWIAGFLGLLGGALGVLTGRAVALLVGIVGLTYASFARASPPPSADLELSRSLSEPEPNPGEAVEVTVTVRNTGDRALADLRVVDGVPTALEVVAGSPRHASALRSGEALEYSYTVAAARGHHGFQAATVMVRDPSGARERTLTVDAGTTLTCEPPLLAVPLQSQTTQYVGSIPTDSGGSGLAFHSTRQYRSGDALSRIDWNRWARTGEFVTIEFREERAAAVMIVVDARAAAYWAPGSADRHAVAHAAAAAGQVFAHLVAGGDQVGITAFGSTDCWLEPAAGGSQVDRARRLLATAPALSHEPPADGPPELAIDPDHDPVDVSPLLTRLDADAQVIVISPLCDDAVVTAAQRIAARGRATTVIGVDVVPTETVGNRLAAMQRANRVHELMESDVSVVDWDVTTSLADTLARAEVRR